MFFDVFLSVAWAFLVGAITPGPDVAMILGNTLLRGRKTGVFIGLGLATGIFIHGLYTIIGFGELYQKYVFFQDMIRYGGGAYLIYLGIRFFISSREKQDLTHTSHEVQTVKQAYFRGLLTNLLNPFAALFVISIILNETQGLGGSALFIPIGLSIIYALFNVGIVYILGNKFFLNKFLKVAQYVSVFSGIVLCFYGLKFIFLF